MMHWLLRSLGLMTLLSSLWLPARSSGSTLYPHEPAGFQRITEFSFSTPTQTGVPYPLYSDPGSQYDSTIVSDGTAPKSPSLVIQDIWNQTKDSGGGYHFVEPLPDNLFETYAAVWWKLSDPFVPYSSCIEKGWKWDLKPGGLSGAVWVGLICAPTFDGKMDVFISLPMNTPGNELMNCQLPATYGDCPGSVQTRSTPGYASPYMAPGIWHFVELYTKHSTCQSCNNGIIRLWIDGQQTHELTTVNFYSQPMLNFVIGQAWSSGAGPGPKAHYFDHMYISAPTGGGGTTDTTPPVAPTALRVS